MILNYGKSAPPNIGPKGFSLTCYSGGVIFTQVWHVHSQGAPAKSSDAPEFLFEPTLNFLLPGELGLLC